MKALLVSGLILASLSAFANTNATSALKKVIPVGLYQGETDDYSLCTIEVKNIQNYLSVVAISPKSIVTKEIFDNSLFHTGKLGRQMVLFFSSDKVVDPKDDTNFVENSLRIVNANDNKINVTVGSMIVNNTDSEEEAVSCTINLK